MEGKTLARIGAIVFVAVAVTATAIEMSRTDERQDSPTPQARSVMERDPLDEELSRCSGLGEAGARDPSCLKAWEENRRRFLGERTPASPPAPAGPTTLFPNEPSADQASVSARPGPTQPIPSRNEER